MRKILVQVAVLLTSMTAPFVEAAIGDIDPNFQSSMTNNCKVDLADDGGLFVSCFTRTINPRNTAEGSIEISISKKDGSGRTDPNWGDNGVAKISADQLLASNNSGCTNACSVALRDGGFALFFGETAAFRLSNRGKLVEGAGGIQPIAVSPSSGPEFGSYWNFTGIQETGDGGFAALFYGTTFGDLRTQSLAVRRFDSQAKFIDESRYAVALDAFTTSSGVKVGGIWPVLTWAMTQSSLEIVVPTSDRLVGVSLKAGGGQSIMSGALITNATRVRYRDPGFYLLPDGKFAYASAIALNRWNTNGTPDLTFGPGGKVFFSRAIGGCVGSGTPRLFVHAFGDYVVLGNEFQNRFVGCQLSYAQIIPANGVAVVGEYLLGPSPPVPFIVDRLGGVIYITPAQGKLVRQIGVGPRADSKVVEFYNSDLDHYFITATESEIAFVDKGNAGASWKRTGNSFGVWNIDTPMPGTNPVCRFYGDLKAGPNSHFYSAEAFECDLLRSAEQATPVGLAAWRFERDAFRITAPVAGVCAPNLIPVVRFYNGKSGIKGDPNHRYVTSQADINAMTAQGWINEDVHLCAVF